MLTSLNNPITIDHFISSSRSFTNSYLLQLTMQRIPNKQAYEKLQLLTRASSMAGDRTGTSRGCQNGSVASPRPLNMYRRSSSHNSRVVQSIRHVVPPTGRLRRRYAGKEVVKRALTPPIRQPTRRWWDFRPTPSRLSTMSTA
ncbi:uncharacterized protein LOC132310366 [Cornus florida]|uniref:uncharacterized protein LOC132310366 n=1 Tax=Cornus florida TaxID=4283 RepID=UPI00289D2B0F|nr:uncharacterized protein LOC132310366 [Cornus florida]